MMYPRNFSTRMASGVFEKNSSHSRLGPLNLRHRTPASEVASALEQAKITPSLQQVTRIPNNPVDLDAATGKKVLKLMERLDDHDDIQTVSANFNIPAEAMAEIGGQD